MSSIRDTASGNSSTGYSHTSVSMRFTRSVACLMPMVCCVTSAMAFPPSYTATINVSPLVPTPQQHVIVTFADTISGFLQPGAVLVDVHSTISGNQIVISAKLGDDPSGPDVLTHSVDLGTLPPGRYSVMYSSDSTANPSSHRASLSFSVSEGGLAAAVEYFNSSLGHYFITADQSEMAKLDQGTIQGWSRTGESFRVMFGETMPSTAVSVCRFYGLPSAGLNSHFFSASATECVQVQERWPAQWLLETTNAFAVASDPTSRPAEGVYYDYSGAGDCPSGSQALYRLYNNRSDANHRYTTSAATRDAMLAQGWILEGSALNTATLERIAMCVPQ